jgi:integrase
MPGMPHNVTRQFARAVARYRAELGSDAPRAITFHEMPHAHITWLYTAGMPVKLIAERVGNSPAVFEATYSHLLPGEQAAWFRRVGQ